MCNPQLALHVAQPMSRVAQTVFDQETCNFTGMLVSMCSCAYRVLICEVGKFSSSDK